MTDRELIAFMQEWFERLLMRFDRIDRHLEKMAIKEKLLEGEKLLDNQDVCQLLNISKRTLQRYRSSGELPYQMIYHKTFYKESDVEAFIKANFAKGESENQDDESSDDTSDEGTDNDNPKDTGDEPEETDGD
ncbi:MAG TPA: helix-turn-helix domain-containing protein [Clostridia bacterium]|nr:helix-turn-helix domain-containing protein [Clostridia bacterium]